MRKVSEVLILEQKEADKYNLIPLCKKHHKIVHNGEISISGFIATSNGLAFHYRYLDDK